MRITCVFVAICLLPIGCNDQPAEEELTIVVREDTRRIAEEKQRLEAERKEVQERKKELNDIEENLRTLSGSGGGDEELKDVLKKLKKQTSFIDSRSRELERRSQRLEADEKNIGSKGAGAATPAARSGGGAAAQELASLRVGQEGLRKDLSSVRTGLAGVEAQLRALTEKLDKLPAGPSVAPMARISSGKVVQRGTVEKTHSKAQKMMRKKGLLVSDLPPDAQGHNAAIKKAMSGGDYTSAQEYALHLQEVTKAMVIDRRFIEGKMGRLVKLRKDRPPAKAIVAEVDRRFESLTKLYTDGKYARANAEINQIVRLLTK